jgi:hypothetical protein
MELRRTRLGRFLSYEFVKAADLPLLLGVWRFLAGIGLGRSNMETCSSSPPWRLPRQAPLSNGNTTA